MKQMTKKEFIEHIKDARNAGLSISVTRVHHRVYMFLVNGLKTTATPIAEGPNIGTAIRHENRYNEWLKAL